MSFGFLHLILLLSLCIEILYCDCGGKVCPAGQKCKNGKCKCSYNCKGRTCGIASQPKGTDLELCPQKSCGTCSSGLICGTNGTCSQQSCSLTVVDCSTRQSINKLSTVFIFLDTLSYSTSITVPASSATTWLVPTTGSFSFSTSADGFQVNNQMMQIGLSTTAVELCVSPASVQIDIRNSLNNISIPVGASISYSGVSNGMIRWNGVTILYPGAFGSFTFLAIPDSLYSNSTLDTQINSDTSMILMYVDPLLVPIPVTVVVVDCSTKRLLSVSSSVEISGSGYSTSLTINGSSTLWMAPSNGTYNFTTSAQGYLRNNQSFTLSRDTTEVQLCVSSATVLVDVRDKVSNKTITVNTTIQFSGVVSGSFKWSSVMPFIHGGYGPYNFTAIPDSMYSSGRTEISISSITTVVIIYVEVSTFCGDGVCNPGETSSNCFLDCISLFFEFENSDGSGPVNGPTMNFYLSNPLSENADTGPNRNNILPATTVTSPMGSNTVLEESYGFNTVIYFEVIVNGFINFYGSTDTSLVDPNLGIFRLRVHLSTILSQFNYRIVNTWRPIDAEPAPYGPTDLNLHLFHPSGAVDLNHPTLVSRGVQLGRLIADSKQSGGPATLEFLANTALSVTLWNAKPPRDPAIAPSQSSRYLVDSGSYVVIYGKTSNAPNGKQLSLLSLDDLFIANPALKSDRKSDLWFIARITIDRPSMNQPQVLAQQRLKASTINVAKDQVFDCEIYSYCSEFVVPYADA